MNGLKSMILFRWNTLLLIYYTVPHTNFRFARIVKKRVPNIRRLLNGPPMDVAKIQCYLLGIFPLRALASPGKAYWQQNHLISGTAFREQRIGTKLTISKIPVSNSTI